MRYKSRMPEIEFEEQCPYLERVGEDAGISFRDEYALKVQKWAEVALRRFPELERGEQITKSEITGIFSELRKAEYEPLPSWSRLNKKQVWELLLKIRGDVARQARAYCPSELERIEAENSSRERDARDYR